MTTQVNSKDQIINKSSAYPVLIREGKFYSINIYNYDTIDIRYELNKIQDFKLCGLNPEDYGITFNPISGYRNY